MKDLFANKIIDNFKNTNIINIPYKGCKRKISYELICEMHKRKPKATTFIDLFGGGGAMTFRALDLGYNVIYNELNNDIYRFVKFVIEQLKDKTKQSKYGILPEEYYNFVSKEEFLKSKKEKKNKEIKDIFNLLYYSFGNNMSAYSFTLLEDYKREGHNMIMFNEPSKKYMERYNFMSHIIQELTNLKLNWREKRLYFVNIILKLEGIMVAMEYNKDILNEVKDLSLIELKSLSNREIIRIINKYTFIKDITIPLKDYVSEKGILLQQLQQLERLERLQQLEQLERLEQQNIKNILLFNKSYDEIDLSKFNNEDVIIYADIPYQNTSKYDNDFDYDKFYNWLKTQREKGYDIFVSEYTKPKYTTEIFSIRKQCQMASAKYKKTNLEKLFIN